MEMVAWLAWNLVYSVHFDPYFALMELVATPETKTTRGKICGHFTTIMTDAIATHRMTSFFGKSPALMLNSSKF